jgi:hypothetical protein
MKYKWHGCHGCARSSGCIQTLHVDIDVDASILLAQWPAFLQVSKVARNMVALVATSIFRFPTANIISCRLHSNMRPGFESDIVPITLRPGSFRRTTGSRQLGGHRTRVVGAGDINSASGHLRSFRLCLRSYFRRLFSSFEATPPSFPNLHLSTSTLSPPIPQQINQIQTSSAEWRP